MKNKHEFVDEQMEIAFKQGEKHTATKILEMIKREIKNLHDASQSMPKQAAYLIALKLIKNKIRKEFGLQNETPC